jgi:DNA-binding LacI/PurR family transcriptional regulator
MKTTIYHIAKAAGVSTATVSKVLNNTGRISDKTAKKILKIVDELRYSPNILASAMKGKHTYQIALLIPDMDNPIYAQFLKHIEYRGQELGFSVVMCSTDNNAEKEERHINLLRKKRVDGFIIASKFINDTLLQELLQDEVPVVLFAHERPELLTDSVTVDDYLGGVIATEHLISQGHIRIGVIAEDSISCKERIRGYTSALQKVGIVPDEDLVRIGGPKINDAEITARNILNVTDRPTAIFGCNDVMAFGVMKAAKKLGISIPDELSLIGFDNTELCSIVTPELTSVAMPVNELGTKAMDILINKINKTSEAKQRIRMLPELAIRESVLKIK